MFIAANASSNPTSVEFRPGKDAAPLPELHSTSVLVLFAIAGSCYSEELRPSLNQGRPLLAIRGASPQFRRNNAEAGKISGWPRKIAHQSGGDRIANYGHDDRNCRGCGFERLGGGHPARDDDIGITSDDWQARIASGPGLAPISSRASRVLSGHPGTPWCAVRTTPAYPVKGPQFEGLFVRIAHEH